jgi:hypothetical protein
MNRSILAIAASTALIISGPAYAQRGHGGGKPTTTSSGSHGPSTTHGSSGATHGKSGATTHGNSGATTHGQSGSHGPKTKPTGTTSHGKSGETHGGSTKHAGAAGTATTDTTATNTTATGNTTSTGSATTLTPVQQKLQKNTNLAEKVQSRLPAGTDLMTASEGFKNLGQFIAAVNVSDNLGLKFTDLKTRMVDEGMSLGQAIQDVKKISNLETEVRRAETEANTMINSTSTTTTSNTTSTNTTTTKKPAKTKTKSPSTEER